MHCYAHTSLVVLFLSPFTYSPSKVTHKSIVQIPTGRLRTRVFVEECFSHASRSLTPNRLKISSRIDRSGMYFMTPFFPAFSPPLSIYSSILQLPSSILHSLFSKLPPHLAPRPTCSSFPRLRLPSLPYQESFPTRR